MLSREQLAARQPIFLTRYRRWTRAEQLLVRPFLVSSALLPTCHASLSQVDGSCRMKDATNFEQLANCVGWECYRGDAEARRLQPKATHHRDTIRELLE